MIEWLVQLTITDMLNAGIKRDMIDLSKWKGIDWCGNAPTQTAGSNDCGLYLLGHIKAIPVMTEGQEQCGDPGEIRCDNPMLRRDELQLAIQTYAQQPRSGSSAPNEKRNPPRHGEREPSVSLADAMESTRTVRGVIRDVRVHNCNDEVKTHTHILLTRHRQGNGETRPAALTFIVDGDARQLNEHYQDEVEVQTEWIPFWTGTSARAEGKHPQTSSGFHAKPTVKVKGIGTVVRKTEWEPQRESEGHWDHNTYPDRKPGLILRKAAENCTNFRLPLFNHCPLDRELQNLTLRSVVQFTTLIVTRGDPTRVPTNKPVQVIAIMIGDM